ncbi:unnamed protein product, partial [marine sediment metagenome]
MTIPTVPAQILALLRKGMPTPSADQTLICKQMDATDAWTTIHTVTAGKTFYLMGIHCSFARDVNLTWELSLDGGVTMTFGFQRAPNVADAPNNQTL